MKFQLGPEIISSYKRLSYTPWYALAEFIDNSTQAYFNNQAILDAAFKREDVSMKVEIELKKEKKETCLIIKDNSIGMTKEELKNAIIVGKPPRNTRGRSKYGIGLKTAACWFGDYWTIRTKKLNSTEEISVEVDVEKIAANHLNLKETTRVVDKNEHYTIITVSKLNRDLKAKTIGKIKKYLRSFYRLDLKEYNLDLVCFGEKAFWEEMDKKLLVNQDGSKVKKEFSFRINKKLVKGWAGILSKGSRSEAGFSLIQAKRVIKGWPDSYRPETLFGSQIGGVNDLVNQRLVGEIYLENFDISHTKDEILFSDDELDALEQQLLVRLNDLKQRAQTLRTKQPDERLIPLQEGKIALEELKSEIESKELKDFLKTFEVPPKSLINKSNKILKDSIVNRHEPNYTAKINSLNIKVYLIEEMSPNDPYVLIESKQSETELIVIINLAHPHWLQIKSFDSILNFIRHCVYDGTAEWKAYSKTHEIDPDTVKLIKDNLLRIPLEMEKHGHSK